jgi:CubicO group peptidase (beta-lactamase class C family)
MIEILDKILHSLMVKRKDGSFRICTLEERMAYYHCTAFSFAVIDNYTVDRVGCFGTKEYQGSEKITPSDPFMAASISKMVTAVAAMKLVVQGVLDLDTDVHTYFKDNYVIPADEGLSNQITLRQIFGHLAGLNVPGTGGYIPGYPLPTLMQVLRGEKPPNSDWQYSCFHSNWEYASFFSKGEEVRVVRPQNILVPCTPENPQGPYSGGGFCIAQKVMCDVTGKDFADLLDELVLTPFGMRNSTFRQSHEPEFITKYPEKLIRGYNPTRGGLRLDHYEMIPGGHQNFTELAAGGLWSTAEDMAKFGVHLLNILHSDNDPALPRTALEEMLRKQSHSENGIGFYIYPTEEPDVSMFGHTGTINGFMSLAYYFTNGKGLVFFFNSNEGLNLYLEFTRAVAKAYEGTFPFTAENIDFTPEQKLTVEVKEEEE